MTATLVLGTRVRRRRDNSTGWVSRIGATHAEVTWDYAVPNRPSGDPVALRVTNIKLEFLTGRAYELLS